MTIIYHESIQKVGVIVSLTKRIKNDANEEVIVVGFVSEEDEILKEIKNIELLLECAYAKFHNVTEAELIDSCIYEIQALQTKYNYFMNLAKTKQIRGVVG